MATTGREKITNLEKKSTSAFLLDQAKLARILNIIEERLNSASIPFEPQFEILLANKKVLKLVSVDNVLGLDNAVKNPIQSITIKAGEVHGSDNASVILRFGAPRSLRLFGMELGDTSTIQLTVSSNNSKFASQFFAELEEQVERTVQSGWLYKRFSGDQQMIGTAMAFGVLVTLLASIFDEPPSGTLSPDVSKRLLDQANHASTESEKINFLFELERRNLEANFAPHTTIDFSAFLNTRTLILIIPLILLLGCVTYLLRTSYPRTVFLWGDYAEHYAHIVSRRMMIWTVVVAAVLIEVVSGLFATEIAKILGIG
jgi:hypothetical protein